MIQLEAAASSQPPVLIVDLEHEVLSDLVCASARATRGITLLWDELQRASLLPAGQAPDQVVRLDSRVYFTDLDRREARMVRLVYPDEAASPNLESVTSIIGAALIGLRPGDVFKWRGADGGVRAVRINRVEAPARPRLR